jgi:hypothetical protein
MVNDCLIHAINYLFRHPIFVTRDQCYQLARQRQRKNADYMISRKVDSGYSVALFSDLIYINYRRYTIEHVKTFAIDIETPVWRQLESFILEQMLGINYMYEQFLLIGSFTN